MCDVCVATGRMTSAEWDQIQAAERDQNLGALLNIVGKIQAREDERRAAIPEPVQPSPEDQHEDETLDKLLATLIGMAEKYEDLPLCQANEALAREIIGAGRKQLAHGLAAIATRLWRNSR